MKILRCKATNYFNYSVKEVEQKDSKNYQVTIINNFLK
jgi:hypothetical protein